MQTVLEAFSLKEYDLDPVLAAWTDAPRFEGIPARDPPVDDWLASVKAGCEQRSIPREYWPKVGQHLLGTRARKRFDELKVVLRHMHGNGYRWDWKRFKVAIRNMGWDIEDDKTETVKVTARSSGSWWILGGSRRVDHDPPPAYTEEPGSIYQSSDKHCTEKKRSDKKQSEKMQSADGAEATAVVGKRKKPHRKASVASDIAQFADDTPLKPKKPSRKDTDASDVVHDKAKKPKPSRQDSAATDISQDKPLPSLPNRPSAPRRMTSWLARRGSSASSASEHELTEEPVMIECVPVAESSLCFWKGGSPSSTPSLSPASSPAQTPGEGAVAHTTTASAPLWLLNACGALDFLNSEHPKAMSTIAAVLITVGSLPALPGISTIAGGTILASHAFQAAGVIAVGVGNWLKASQDASAASRQEDQPAQAPASSQQTASTKAQ